MFKNDIVQFTEKHKWCGCLGIINEIKDTADDCRCMIAVPIPDNESGTKTAFIFSMGRDNEFEVVGRAVLGFPDNEEE